MSEHDDLKPKVGYAVDKGKTRSQNEDSAAAVEADIISGDDAQSVGLYAVADGMGGHQSGEVASRLAIRRAIKELTDKITHSDGEVSEDYARWLDNALQAANRYVYQNNPAMGTTLVMAMVLGGKGYIASVGDSRAYLITPTEMHQITEDQSFVQQLVKMGTITPQEAENHPRKNILMQAIGANKTLEIDFHEINILPDTHLLLCTDGLTNDVPTREIFEIVHGAPDPQTACEELITRANAAGGHDNISVVLVSFSDHV